MSVLDAIEVRRKYFGDLKIGAAQLARVVDFDGGQRRT
ncbi:hypothetical protein BXY66_1003 [Shimia isoporae]|uniref:Uncharacterized protein n=1 Tax=Shimia isoporae TaxID=647720 RepID=A0A4R1NV68_9RHOB|nr:hypothetical protein BXY66_1003 [Shimia isoporae]